jgi:hypothetical protein
MNDDGIEDGADAGDFGVEGIDQTNDFAFGDSGFRGCSFYRLGFEGCRQR